MRALPLVVFLLLAGCGPSSGPGATEATHSTGTFDPVAFLTTLGAEASPIFRPPERSSDEIDTERRAARGAERRTLMRDLAVALLSEAEAEEPRPARRIRQRADRMLAAARRGNRDDNLAAELDMIDLWRAWRAEQLPRAARLSERFTRRHEAAGVLTGIAWMIRGEVAQAQDEYDAAQDLYRFALGQIGTPLYAFALYRTAHAHRALGENDESVQAFEEVEQMGCEEGAAAQIVELSTAAASEQGSGLRMDTDGVTRPSACPSPEERAEEEPEEEGWRPAE